MSVSNGKGKSFWDLYENASASDQKELIGQLLAWLSGKPTNPIVPRTTFKVSTLMSPEEIRLMVADNMGISLDMVPEINVEQFVKGGSEQWLDLEAFIAEHKKFVESNEKQPSKIEELYDVGRFLRSCNHDLKIVTPERPFLFPDFIIKDRFREFGIEHVRLINNDAIALFKKVNQIIENAMAIILTRNPSATGFVNFYFNYEEQITSKYTLKMWNKVSANEKNIVTETIAKVIEQYLIGERIALPNYISDIKVNKHPENKLEIIQAERYLAKHDMTEYVDKAIAKKEMRLATYLGASGLKACWLLIIVEGVSGFSGFDLKNFKYTLTTNSGFEKIFLYESFSWTKYEIK